QLTVRQEEEKRLNFILQNHLPTSTGPGTDLTGAQLGDISKQLLQASNDRKNAEAAYEAASTAKDPMSIPEVNGDKRIQTLRDNLDKLEQRRADLLQTYTEAWPEVKKVEAQIKTINQALDETPKQIIASMKTRME